MAGRIRDSIRAAQDSGITDPTFVTLGEEFRRVFTLVFPIAGAALSGTISGWPD
jgi:hypothetical protein